MVTSLGWGEAKREEVRQLYFEHGPSQAADMSGVPLGTVKYWSHRYDWSAAAERWHREALIRKGELAAEEAAQHQRDFKNWKTDAEIERERTRWDQEFALAYEIVNQIAKLEMDARARDVKDRAIAIGVLIDKLRLIQGEATNRTEVISLGFVESKIRELEAELGAAG